MALTGPSEPAGSPKVRCWDARPHASGRPCGGSRRVKRTATAAAVLAVLLLAAAPAFAQGDQISSMAATATAEGSPPPPGPPGSNIPDYEFRDG